MDSLSKYEFPVNFKRCFFKKFKKVDVVKSSGVNFGSHLSILMFCLKIKDAIHDGQIILLNNNLNVFANKVEKKSLNHLKKNGFNPQIYHNYLIQQFVNEKKSLSFYDYSAPTEEFLSNVFSYIGNKNDMNEDNINSLSEIGKNIGRLVYLYDNLCDLPFDIKKNRFNPFLNYTNIQVETFSKEIFIESANIIELNLNEIEFKDNIFKDIIYSLLKNDINETYRNLFAICIKSGFKEKTSYISRKKQFAANVDALCDFKCC